MMSTNEECPMEIQTPSDDGDERSAIVKSLNDWMSAEILGRQPIPELRLLMKNVFRTWRETFQLITFCGSENCNSQSVLFVERLFTLPDVGIILSQCGNYLKELSLSEFCDSSIMKIVGEHCKNLTKLEFVFDKTLHVNDTNHYTEAFKQLNKLVSIKIQVINTCKNARYIEKFPIEIIDSLPKGINEIHLFFEGSSQQQYLASFKLTKFEHLHSLTMRYCNLQGKMIKAISKKSTLKYLDIRDSWVRDSSWPSFKKLVNLKHIDLPASTYNSDILGEDVSSIREDVVSSIFNTCKYLEYFDMSARSSDQSEPNISLENWANLGNLDHLGIGWEISDAFADKMVDYCKKLKYLDCKNINNHTIIKKLTKLQNLECLKLHDWIFYSAETITAISTNCKKLKRLEIVHSDQYLNANIDARIMNKLSALQYLEYLDLSRLQIDTSTNSIQLQDVTIIRIADNCKNLKYLNIGGCISLTEDAFNALTKLKNLKELTVDHTAVTNNFVGKLEGLTFFSCVGCVKLTEVPENGIIQLINNCPDLEQLVLGSIDNIITLKKIIAAADSALNANINKFIILYIRISGELSKDPEFKIKSPWLVVDSSSLKETSED